MTRKPQVEDARFEDGRETALNLGALTPDDLQILSALVQDAVFPAAEMTWRPRDRRLAVLVNRFRWEDGARDRHGAERVRALLVVDQVLGVASTGFARGEKDMVLSILSLDWAPDADPPGGTLTLLLAGDGAIRARVEALEITLKDVTRPYSALSGRAPDHG